MPVLCYLNISRSNKVENLKIKIEENALGSSNEIWNCKVHVNNFIAILKKMLKK